MRGGREPTAHEAEVARAAASNVAERKIKENKKGFQHQTAEMKAAFGARDGERAERSVGVNSRLERRLLRIHLTREGYYKYLLFRVWRKTGRSRKGQ